jgi:hypothetical protein
MTAIRQTDSGEMVCSQSGILGWGRVPGPISAPALPAIDSPEPQPEAGSAGEPPITTARLRVDVRWNDTKQFASGAKVTVLGPEVPAGQKRERHEKTAETGVVTFDEVKDRIKPGVKYIILADGSRPGPTASLTVCLKWRQTLKPTGNATVSLEGPNGKPMSDTNNAGSCVTFGELAPGTWIYKGDALQPDGLMQSPTEEGSILLPEVPPQMGHGEDGPLYNPVLNAGLPARKETIISIALNTKGEKGHNYSRSLAVNIGGAKPSGEIWDSVWLIHPDKPEEWTVTLDDKEMAGGLIKTRVFDLKKAHEDMIKEAARRLLIPKINKKKREIKESYAPDEVEFSEPTYSWYWWLHEWDPLGKCKKTSKSDSVESSCTWKWKLQINYSADFSYRVISPNK